MKTSKLAIRTSQNAMPDFHFHIYAFLRNLIMASMALLISLTGAKGQAPEIKFRYLSREDGLSNSTVNKIYQDSRKYIWIGTRDGLNLFDGYKVTVYKKSLSPEGSLSNNYINDIIEDSGQKIWIATNYGLNVYDRNTDRFTSYMHDPGNPNSLSSNFIISLHTDQKGNLWIGTSQGINRYDPNHHHFKRYPHPVMSDQAPEGSRINCMASLGNSTLLIGTEGDGLKKFDIHQRRFLPYTDQDKALSQLNHYRVTSINKDLSNNLWIATQGEGLFRYNISAGTIKQFQKDPLNKESLSSNVIKYVTCDRQNNIWISTENEGLNLKPADRNSFIRYENDPRNPHSFSSKTAICIMEDVQGNIWIGSHHGKVNIYSPSLSRFRNYTSGAWQGALSFNNVRAFCEDNKGRIWVGTDGGGINVLDKNSDKFSYYRYEQHQPNSIGSNAVVDIKKDRNGSLWVATWGGGISRFNPETQTFTRFQHDPDKKNSLSSNFTFYLHPDRQGLLWIASFYGGLNTFDPGTNQFKRIRSAPDGKTQFKGNDIIHIHEGPDGAMWISTLDGGLNYLTPDRQQFYHYFDNSTDDLRDAVNITFTDSKKRLWAGKTGLYLFDNRKKKFALYSDNPYLANEQILSISEDKKGNLWIGTSNGLLQLNPETNYIKRYTEEDGLQGIEFSRNASYVTSKGEMFFGGLNGFNSFYPDSIKSYHYNYPVYITDLSVFNKSIRSTHEGTIHKYISENRNLVLKHDQSVISFDYAALNYVSPTQTHYAYKLEGFDDKWNYVGTQRKATYTNLDPGDYTFLVKAGSPDGEWTLEPASLRLTITPPFYFTWWFKTLSFILISLAIFFFLFYRRKAELKAIHEKNKEKMYQLQLQFFTNISHEFRTPLTLITGSLEQVFKLDPHAAISRHYQTIHRNANRLLHLISELMDFRKVESGTLKLRVMPGNFSSFLNEIVQDFNEQAISDHIDFTTRLDKEYNQVWFDRQVLEKILLNLLNNAFKYTPDGGKISIRVSSSREDLPALYKNTFKIENEYKAQEFIYISVIDNGIGISKDSIEHLFERFYKVSDTHLGSGIGLAFVKSLTFLHKGSIYVDSERYQGTQIIISIPSNQEAYKKEEQWPENHPQGAQIESVPFKEASPGRAVQPEILDPVKQEPDVSRKDSLLLVEDNEELRAFLKEVLEPEYYIIEAANGEEGLQQARETSPALIISDLMMPVMDGIELCKRIKEDFETSHIPFILLTAKDALASRLEGAESGADYYFSKPLSTDLLMLTIRNIIKQKQKIKERYLKDYQVEVRDLVNTSKDKAFMDKLLHLIEEKLDQPDLNTDYICREMGVSSSKLYKKIKDITGQGIAEFIRTIRLKKAVEIMTHEDILVTEVMYRVGILSKSYFTNAFKKEFGITPSQFQQQLDKKMIIKKAK